MSNDSSSAPSRVIVAQPTISFASPNLEGMLFRFQEKNPNAHASPLTGIVEVMDSAHGGWRPIHIAEVGIAALWFAYKGENYARYLRSHSNSITTKLG